MKRLFTVALLGALVLACGDNNKGRAADAAPDTPDEVDDDGFVQVEHLARPGINEALILTNDFNVGYNATAPGFAGVPGPTLNAIVGEAKTVLKALYLGACLLNGVLGVTPAAGVKPAGIQCHAVGAALFESGTAASGTVLTEMSQMKAQEYADKVFGQFIPDVMRIDTSVDSFYQTLCGDATTAPLLCGGRFLNDDTIDITYDYLLNGAGTPSGTNAVYGPTAGVPGQVAALVSDGVNYSRTDAGQTNKGNRVPHSTTTGNTDQGHPNVSNAFPYSAKPF